MTDLASRLPPGRHCGKKISLYERKIHVQQARLLI